MYIRWEILNFSTILPRETRFFFVWCEIKQLFGNFQAGLAELLFRKFRIPLIVLTVYFLLCVSHHVWILLDQQSTAQSVGWPAPLTTLFIIQRMCKHSPFPCQFFPNMINYILIVLQSRPSIIISTNDPHWKWVILDSMRIWNGFRNVCQLNKQITSN